MKRKEEVNPQSHALTTKEELAEVAHAIEILLRPWMDVGGGQERDEAQEWDNWQSSDQRWDNGSWNLMALKIWHSQMALMDDSETIEDIQIWTTHYVTVFSQFLNS